MRAVVRFSRACDQAGPLRTEMHASSIFQSIAPFPLRRNMLQLRGDETMKISDIMTRDVCIAAPEQTVREAAKKMAEIDAGMLPVSENDRLVGMVTDRDIAI